jgi:hypothetical protein
MRRQGPTPAVAKSASKGPRAGGPTADSILIKLEQAEHHRSRHERGAWAALSALAFGARSSEARRLTGPEAVELAQRMDRLLEELTPLLRAKGISQTSLCQRAFPRALSSKELYRLRLPAGEDPAKRQLRTTPRAYHDLLKALAETTGKSVRDLAYRLLVGTSLYLAGPSISHYTKVDLVAAELEELVSRLAVQFNWHELYRQTAARKLEQLHAGSHCCWPLYDLDSARVPLDDPDELKEYEADLQRAMDPTQAFRRPWSSSVLDASTGSGSAKRYFDIEQGHLQDDSFFFVPHAPIGYVLLWDLPDQRADPIAYNLEREKQLAHVRKRRQPLLYPRDDWDDANQSPKGQTGADPSGMDWSLQWHSWLIAYPDEQQSGVVPCFYFAGEEGGAFLAPLNVRTLDWLSQAMWYDDERHLPLLDRLLELLEAKPDDRPSELQQAFERTGGWLAFNPILQAHARQEQQRQELIRRLADRQHRRRL